MADMHPFTFLVLLFAAISALYALLLHHEKDILLIPKHYSMKPKNKKEYAKRFSWIILMLSGTCALSALVSLFSIWAGVAVLAIGFIATCYFGWKVIKPVM